MIPFRLNVPSYEVAFVARVIYSEASPSCTPNDRLLVASVIHNRIGHPGFNRPSSAYFAVGARGQFSCIGDARNLNWERTARFATDGGADTEAECSAWMQCVELARGNFTPVPDVVYYHDRSVCMPRSWDNRWWTPSLERTTVNFMFYSVSPKA